MIIRVKGGGVEGQVIASRLGVARALLQVDENLHHDFKEHGYLTRDSRKKERKKYGHAKARKRFQLNVNLLYSHFPLFKEPFWLLFSF